MSEPAVHKPSCTCNFSMPTIDILYVGMIEANYSVHEDRNLWDLAKRMQTVRARRKRREDDGGRPGV